MRSQRLRLFSFSLLGLTGMANAQNDGDHLITNFAGQTSLAVDVQATAAPVNLTIGTTPGSGATLRVRGDELPIGDDFIGGTTLCTFRTDVPAATEQSWWMYRGILRIGRIRNESGHRAFHLQSMLGKDNGQDRYSGPMPENDRSPQG